jgi:hypothetical protein
LAYQGSIVGFDPPWSRAEVGDHQPESSVDALKPMDPDRGLSANEAIALANQFLDRVLVALQARTIDGVDGTY